MAHSPSKCSCAAGPWPSALSQSHAACHPAYHVTVTEGRGLASWLFETPRHLIYLGQMRLHTESWQQAAWPATAHCRTARPATSLNLACKSMQGNISTRSTTWKLHRQKIQLDSILALPPNTNIPGRSDNLAVATVSGPVFSSKGQGAVHCSCLAAKMQSALAVLSPIQEFPLSMRGWA